MSIETEIQTLAAALKGHTAALAELAAAVRAVATGRSLNATPAGIDQARPADEKAAAPAETVQPVEPAEQEKTGAPQAKPETETAAAELAAMSPADFMERIRELTQGVPGARGVLVRVLAAHGWASFRALEPSEYPTAINAIAAELAGGRA